VVGTVARTAVIAGTATVTANAVSDRHARKQGEQYDQQMAAQQQYDAAQVPAAQPAGNGADIAAQIEQLSKLRQSGAISEGEFEVAKTKLLSQI
jgi:sigma54-dependent transcription regulator